MSMSQSLQATNTSADVIDVMQLPNGKFAVRVLYLDNIARPDLAGKKSAWLDWTGDKAPEIGEVCRMEPVPQKTKFGVVWSGYVRPV